MISCTNSPERRLLKMLSIWFDGEASEKASALVLREIHLSDLVRDRLIRYQIIRTVIQQNRRRGRP
jgi:hypothetical protein